MLNVPTIKEMKEIEQRKMNLIQECKQECMNLENQINLLTKEHSTSVLSALKPTRLFSKKRTTESIEAELTQLRAQLKVNQEKLTILKNSSVKNEVSLEKIIQEMEQARNEQLKELQTIQKEAEKHYNHYTSKAEEYTHLVKQVNNEISATNMYLERIFNDDVLYRNGCYWDETGKRVDRERVGIHTITENNKLMKKEGI